MDKKMTGLGSGIVLLWLYNDVLAPYFSLAPMPADVAAVLAAAVVEYAGQIKAPGEGSPAKPLESSRPDPD